MRIKDWANRLIFATILITVVRYMGAFASSDLGRISGTLSEIFTILLSISGVGMGLLDVLGGGLLFNGWKNVMPRSGDNWSFRFKVLTFCVFGLVISGLIIIVPFTVSRMTQESIVDALGGKDSIFTWIWATMVVVVPYFLIAGVFVGNKMVEGLESEAHPRKVAEPEKKVSSNLPVDWRRIRPTLGQEQLRFLATSTSTQIVNEFAKSGIHVSPRTAINWKYNAQEELKK